MSTVLLIVHVMIAAALIGVVLLQRSEGGALGIGGGGGGFMTGRGAANLLTRVTAGLAAAFFATSLLLSIIATRTEAPRSILDAPPAGVPGQPSAPRPQGAPQGAPGLPQIDLNKIPDAPLPADPPKVPQSK
jgi:preprotein translocase subunit SecG